jgi:hypothetical protein
MIQCVRQKHELVTFVVRITMFVNLNLEGGRVGVEGQMHENQKRNKSEREKNTNWN